MALSLGVVHHAQVVPPVLLGGDALGADGLARHQVHLRIQPALRQREGVDLLERHGEQVDAAVELVHGGAAFHLHQVQTPPPTGAGPQGVVGQGHEPENHRQAGQQEHPGGDRQRPARPPAPLLRAGPGRGVGIRLGGGLRSGRGLFGELGGGFVLGHVGNRSGGRSSPSEHTRPACLPGPARAGGGSGNQIIRGQSKGVTPHEEAGLTYAPAVLSTRILPREQNQPPDRSHRPHNGLRPADRPLRPDQDPPGLHPGPHHRADVRGAAVGGGAGIQDGGGQPAALRADGGGRSALLRRRDRGLGVRHRRHHGVSARVRSRRLRGRLPGRAPPGPPVRHLDRRLPHRQPGDLRPRRCPGSCTACPGIWPKESPRAWRLS